MTENQDKVGERGKDTPASGNEDLIDSDGNAIVEQPDLPVQDDRRPPLVQISKAARLSAVFALAGPVCFIVFLSPLGWLFVFIPMLGSLLIMAVPILCAIAFILGVFGLVSIAFSGGRRTGYAYAMVGISVPLMGVLFLDSHVEFEKRPYCGLQDDNIYTISEKPATGDPVGKPPTFGSHPANAHDSLLVNDPLLSSR